MPEFFFAKKKGSILEFETMVYLTNK